MLELLFFAPLVAGAAMLLPVAFPRRGLLVATAVLHTALTVLLFVAAVRRTVLASSSPGALTGCGPEPSALGGLLAPDTLGWIFLLPTSLLFLAASIYAVGYLRGEAERGEAGGRVEIQDSRLFTNAPEGRFLACLCFFLAAMTLVTTTPNLGALWVGIELTTLASAPLIYFHRHQRSLEATWKYLLICSVGIALALLGNILLSVAFHGVGGPGCAEAGPDFPALAGMDQLGGYLTLAGAGQAQLSWLKAAFIFIFVGYGTKMGLAPFHNWLPDAHSQAPSLVSGLLSGALLNCAFLGILRAHQILLAAGQGHFSRSLLVFFGLLSMITAAVFIVGQGHYKRLLAYSSVEHMGILALGVGIGEWGSGRGGVAAYGALLHLLSHSLTKGMLFLLAGNILTRYHTLSSYDVRGMRHTMPLTAALWLAGFLAVTGAPPFGLFISELLILQGIFQARAWVACVVYLGTLAVIFVGMSIPVLRMVQGPRPRDMPEILPESRYAVLPPLALGLLVLGLGLYIPVGLSLFLQRGAALLGMN